MVKGTKRILNYHGAMIHGENKSLFVGCHHVAKNESKIPFMIQMADWLIDLGVNVKVCVVDREYYRYDVLNSFKKRNIDVVTPAKNYKQLKNCKNDYLNNKKGRIQQYTLGTMAKKGKQRKLMKCWVLLYARGNQSLYTIKSNYRQGIVSLTEESGQIYALITTTAPQYHSKSFVYTIKRYYKMR